MSSTHSPHKKQAPMFKRPMSYSPVKPTPTRKEQLSMDLGIEYEELRNGSRQSTMSSSDDENINPLTAAAAIESGINVKYQALKRQISHLTSERESLMLKTSKLKDKLKHNERQLEKEESDRKNQLNIMKNTHEQTFNEKNRIIQLFESVVKEQECELELLRKTMQIHGHMMGELQVSQNSIAISRLTVQLDQIIQEKNDILAQFFGQQSLIKQQQSELKSLLRCKSENADLTSQTTAQKKTIHTLTKTVEDQKKMLAQSEVELALLKNDLESLKNSPRESANDKSNVVKLGEKITKLQDKLLRKEAEYMEMDFEHRQKIQGLDEAAIDREQQIRQLKLDLHQNSQQKIVTVREVPVESEAAKKELSTAQAEIQCLTSDVQKLKTQHKTQVESLSTQHKQAISKLEVSLAEAQRDNTEISESFRNRDEKEKLQEEKHKKALQELEKQVKQKKCDMLKLRQEMADKIGELEQQRDHDLEQLELQLKHNESDATAENKHIKHQLTDNIIPQIAQLKTECRNYKKLCEDLQRLHRTEIKSTNKQISAAIVEVSERNKDLVRKYRKEMSLRKKYHNQLVQLKGNIRVFCRIRPSISEDGPSQQSVITPHEDDEDMLVIENKKGRSQTFEMDRLFTQTSTQTQVFDDVRALVTSVIDGYHVCIFAYGQTGSGKTYTMEGPQSDPGINQRALAELFIEAEKLNEDWRFEIRVSVLEIYNETVRDLLSDDPSDKLDIKLNQEGNLHVRGLSWVAVSNVDDVNKAFLIGHNNRATASTNMNEHSSRSHALLCVEVLGENITTGAKTLGKLNLVDLAGSERVSKSGADGARLKEAQSINKSLSALGDVISALRNKQSFVPYRNSKLTYLLQESLGGDSKVLMIVQVAPIERHVNETLCSLNFAQRVRSVELGMASNRRVEAGGDMSALKGRLNEGQSPMSTPTKSSTPQGTPSRRK